ncbi:MAG: hypothetical protein CSA49_06150, partial [Gammaproteobacteria bacterium]
MLALGVSCACAYSLDEISDSSPRVSLTNHLKVYETPANSEPVTNRDLKYIIQSAVKQDSFTITSPNTDYWFYGSFKTGADLSTNEGVIVLDHPYPRYESVTLVLDPLSDSPIIIENNNVQSIHKRMLQTRLMAFEVPIQAGRDYDFLVKVHSLAKQPFSLSAQTTKNFLANGTRIEFLWGLFFGMFFIAALYNLLVYVATQHRMYLYYVCFIITTGLAQAGATNHGLSLIWTFADNWHQSSSLFFISISSLFGILFTQSFLKTRQRAPKIHILLSATQIPCLFLAVFSQVLRFDIATSMTDITIAWLMVLMMSAGIISYQSGEKTARFFLLGWGSLLTCLLVYIAMMRGLIPANAYTLFTPQIGSVLEISILTMAIADRIRQDRQAKAAAIKLQNSMIGKLQKAEDALLQQALHDANTGLANQNMLDRAMTNVIKDANPQVNTFLALIKIKGLRDINNTLGRYVGDELSNFVALHLKTILQGVPAQFKSNLNQQGENLAVIQGVTFAFLIKAPSSENAINLVTNSLKQLPKRFQMGSISLDLETYAGICSIHQANFNREIWLRNAFVSIEQALQFSNICQLYDEAYNPYSERRLSLINDLKHAVENDELQIYLQPQLDSKTRSIVSAEALLRWLHPEHGFVPPDEFVGLAENSGVIKLLTRWVITNSVKALKKLHQQGYLLSISINISPHNLEEEDLTAFIIETLTRYKINPNYLTFEMTETAMMANLDLASDILKKWHKLGFTTAIDDFGTGYSSMAHLKRLPMKELKIDRSFIKDMLSSDEDQHIVQATLTIGHSLGMRVVAEGVEDEALLLKLSELECDLIQGYHLTKPLSMDDFIHWLQTTKYSIGYSNLHPIGST